MPETTQPTIAQITETLFLRELRALRREVEAYPDEAQLWLTPGGVSNSAGNLALHLCGNLQHFIGAKLGESGYVRDRNAEFSRRDASRAEILREIDATMAAVSRAFERIDDTTFSSAFPEPIATKTVSTGEWVIHLVAHLGYHVGQIDYHRRIVTGDATTLDVVSTRELPSTIQAF